MSRCVSAFPFGLLELVNPCLIPSVARLHERHRRRLTAVITHAVESVVPVSVRELALHRVIQRDEPANGLGVQLGMVPDTRLRVPTKDQDEVDPADGLDHYLAGC